MGIRDRLVWAELHIAMSWQRLTNVVHKSVAEEARMSLALCPWVLPDRELSLEVMVQDVAIVPDVNHVE